MCVPNNRSNVAANGVERSNRKRSQKNEMGTNREGLRYGKCHEDEVRQTSRERKRRTAPGKKMTRFRLAQVERSFGPRNGRKTVRTIKVLWEKDNEFRLAQVVWITEWKENNTYHSNLGKR